MPITYLQSENPKPKRAKIESVGSSSRDLFDEDDSDAETEPDFWNRRTPMERGAWKRATLLYPEGRERRCLDLPLCHKDQHPTDFEGLPIVEIFKVKVKFNKHYGTTPILGRLYGQIETVPDEYLDLEEDNPDPISYYSVSRDKAEVIHLDADNDFALLPISSPVPRPPICKSNCLVLRFSFKIDDKDIFTSCGIHHQNPELFGNDGCKGDIISFPPGAWDDSCRDEGHYIVRTLVGVPSPKKYCTVRSCDPLLMAAYISVFKGAWATVDVKMLRDGVGRFHGLIVARPCVFNHRLRLLTIQPSGKKKVTIEPSGDGELDEDTRSIRLTRSVVAVPYYSSLIIGAALYGDDDGEIICRGKLAFAARGSGEETSIITHNGIETLSVKVQWTCQKA